MTGGECEECGVEAYQLFGEGCCMWCHTGETVTGEQGEGRRRAVNIPFERAMEEREGER